MLGSGRAGITCKEGSTLRLCFHLNMANAQRRFLTKLIGGWRDVKLPRSWGGYFRNDFDHRDFAAIGASAGAP
jgi:hypothetical protein